MRITYDRVGVWAASAITLIASGMFVLYTSPAYMRRGVPIVLENSSTQRLADSNTMSQQEQYTTNNNLLQNIVDAIEEDGGRRRRDEIGPRARRQESTKSLRVKVTQDNVPQKASVEGSGTTVSISADETGYINTRALNYSFDSTMCYGSTGSASHPLKVDTDGKLVISGTITATNLDVSIAQGSDSIVVYGNDGNDGAGTNRAIKTDANGVVEVSGSFSSSPSDESTDSVLVYGNDGNDGAGTNRAIKTDSVGNVQVDVVSGSVIASATDLDVRDLSESQDSVLVYGSDDSGTTKRVIATDSSGNIQVNVVSGSVIASATDLDVRDLSESQDSVLVYGSNDGGTTKRVIATDASGNVQVDVVSGTVTANAGTGTMDVGVSQASDSIQLFGNDGSNGAGTNRAVRTAEDGKLEVELHAGDDGEALTGDGSGNLNVNVQAGTLSASSTVGTLSTANSVTAETIIASATWYGDWEECYDQSSITVFARDTGDGTSTAGSMSVEFAATDQAGEGVACTGMCRTVQLSTGIDTTFGAHSLIPVAKWFRVNILNNDGVNSLVVDVQTILDKNPRVALTTSRLSSSLDPYTDVLNVRAVLEGRDAQGTYQNIKADGEGNMQVNIATASSEFRMTSVIPRIRASGTYGFIPSNFREYTDAGGEGTVSVNAVGEMVVTSGLTAGSYGTLQSFRTLGQTAGTPITIKFGARFDVTDNNCQAGVGFVSLGDELTFGYDQSGGTATFGIHHKYHGVPEIQSFTVDVPAGGGGETLTLYINDAVADDDNALSVYTITLSESDAETNAHEIATQLNAEFFFGLIAVAEQIADTVQITFRSDTPKSETFGYDANGGVFEGTWTQINPASPKTEDFIPQADWDNQNLGFTLDVTNGNNYQIDVTDGYGSANFYIENPENYGRLVLVHTISAQNTLTAPLVGNPSVRAGAYATAHSDYGTVVVTGTVYVSHILAGIVSKEEYRVRNPRSFSHTKSIGITSTNILTLRNMYAYGNRPNQVSVYPSVVTFANDGGKSAVFEVIAGATIDVPTIFEPIGVNLATTVDTTGGNYLGGGNVLVSVVVAKGQSVTTNLADLDIVVPPSLELSIVAYMTSTTAELSASINWYEDV